MTLAGRDRPRTGRLGRLRSDRFVRDSAWLTFALLLVNLSNYGMNVGLGRLLGREAFGVVASLLAVLFILNVPTSALQTVLTREVSQAPDDAARRAAVAGMRRLVLPWALATAAVVAAATPLVAVFLHLATAWPAALLGPALGLSLWLPLGRGVLQGRRDFPGLTVAIGAEAAVRLAAALGAAAIGLGEGGVLGAFLLAMAASLVVGRRLSAPLLGRSAGPAHAGPRLPLGEVLPAIAALGLVTILFNLDVVLARHWLSPAASGEYAAVSLAGRVLFYVTSSVGGAVVASRDVVDERARGRLLLKGLAVVCGSALAGEVVFALAGRTVLGLLFGPSYREGASALTILGVGMVLLCAANLAAYFLLALRGRLFVAVQVLGIALEVAAIALRHEDPLQVAQGFALGAAATAAGLLGLAVAEVRRGPRRPWAARTRAEPSPARAAAPRPPAGARRAAARRPEPRGAPSRRRALLHSRLVQLCVVGAAIRLVLAPFTSWTPDVQPWLTRTLEAAHGTPLYENLTFSYPPLFGWIIELVTAPVAWLRGTDHLALFSPSLQPLALTSQILSSTVPTPLFTFAVKLPAIAADIATGVVIHSIVRDLTGARRRADIAAAAWLLNPISIWVAAVHGQFDPLPALMTVVAVRHMLLRQWFWTGLALSVGMLLKAYPAYLLPAAGLFILYDVVAVPSAATAARRVQLCVRRWMALGVGAALPLLVVVPQLVHSRFTTAVFSRSETQAIGSGMDMWFPGTLPPVGDQLARIASVYTALLTVALYGGSALVLGLAALRWRDRPGAILTTCSSMLVLVLLCAPNTNPQFMVWALPVLITAAAAGSRYPRWALGVLSVVPCLFYLAQWGGNPLAMLLPAAVHFGVPLSASSAAHSLAVTLAEPGPFGIDGRLWMMVAVQAAVVVALLRLVVPPGAPVRLRLRAGTTAPRRRVAPRGSR